MEDTDFEREKKGHRRSNRRGDQGQKRREFKERELLHS